MIESARRILSRYSHLNWALADQTMVSGVNFLTGIMLARFLGVEEFGRFTLVWMAVLFASSLQHAMINAPMMSIGPKQSEAGAPAYYGAVFVQQAAFAGLSFLLLWLGVWAAAKMFPEWGIENLALPLACAALAFQMQDYLRRYFFTRGRPVAAFINDAISYLGQLAGLVVVVAMTQLHTAAALWVIGGTSAIAAIVGWFAVGHIVLDVNRLRETSIRHWQFSKWLVASALMYWVSGNVFIVMAGIFLGPTTVGALKAAQNIMGITHILFQGLENFVPSRAAHIYHREGKDAFVAFLRKVSWAICLATAAVAVLAFFSPEFWLDLVYGKEFTKYSSVLQWYALIYVSMSVAFPLRAGLRTLEETKPIFLAGIWSAGFSVVFSYLFVISFGILGVLYGIFVMNLLGGLILYFGFRVALKNPGM